MTTPVQKILQALRWQRRKPWRAVDLLARLVLLVPFAICIATFSSSGHRLPDLAAQFTAPALVATAGLTVVLALARLRMAACSGFLACALLFVAVGPQWFPNGPEAANETPALRLYSANLWAGNTETDAITASIRAADADVVLLIELGDAPAARLDQILTGYPHRVATRRINRVTGPARSIIASRRPLSPIPDRADGLHAVAATLETAGGPVHLVGVHLTRPWPFQEQWGQISQTMALEAVVKDLRGPVVVAGDFNSVATARIGRQVQKDIGLHPAPGFPGTWPAFLPSWLGVTIDQVWATRDLAFVSRRVGAANGSDHYPVVTEISRATN